MQKMMDVMEAIYTRRSIRKFKNRKIDRETIREILKAAMYAPSARDCRPWHFIVVDDRSVLKAFMEVHPYSSMLKEASHGILVCGDLKLQNGPGYWVVDCGAAAQNLLLAAHGMGLGAVWLGIHPRQERQQAVHHLFRLPDHVQPFCMVALGYPDEKKEMPDRFMPERIHHNSW